MAGSRYPTGIKVAVGGLSIGAEGSEVAITATAAELNSLTGITAGKPIVGSQFVVTYPQVAAADVAKTFFIAPFACKIVSATERHVTVAGQAGTLTIEKLTGTQAPGAGAVTLAADVNLAGTANTAQTVAAVTTAAGTLAVGNALCLKVASGSASSYALGTITVLMQVV